MFRPSQAQREEEEAAADALFLSVFIYTHMYTVVHKQPCPQIN
jgi:hypothetical protein